jgi:hypothetical protein
MLCGAVLAQVRPLRRKAGTGINKDYLSARLNQEWQQALRQQ